MTFPLDPADRSPKGDHNRRLSLGLAPEKFAALAGITTEELLAYESTWPDHEFETRIAAAVGAALERLEAERTGMVDNGPKPAESFQDLDPDRRV